MYDLPVNHWEMISAMALMIPCQTCHVAAKQRCIYFHCDAINPGATRWPHQYRLQIARETLDVWRHVDEKVNA